MKKLLFALILLSAALACAQSTLKSTANLTAACTNATTTCDGTAGSQLKLPVGEYSIASITVHGTFTGVTLFFEFSDDGGTNWYPSTCTRNDAATQETSEAISDSTNRSWDCGTAAAGIFRIRQHAISTGTVIMNASQSAIQFEPAQTVSVFNPDPCANLAKSIQLVNTTASATLITGTAGKKIYICSINLMVAAADNVAIVEGTGTICATGIAGMFGGSTAATGWNFAANGGLTLGAGIGTIGVEATAADNVCVLASAAVQLSGSIAYVVQ